MEQTVIIAFQVDFTKHRTMCLFRNLFNNIILLIIATQMTEYHASNLRDQTVTLKLDICVQPTKI